MKNTSIYQIYYQRYPYPFRFGSYHALLRSLTIHSLVNRLYKSSRLSQQTYERLMRTRQLIRSLIYYDADSSEVKNAIASINQAHVGSRQIMTIICMCYQPFFSSLCDGISNMEEISSVLKMSRR